MHYLQVDTVSDAEVVDTMRQDPREGRGVAAVGCRGRRHGNGETRSATADKRGWLVCRLQQQKKKKKDRGVSDRTSDRHIRV